MRTTLKLNTVLIVDAAGCAVMGAGLMAASGPLGQATALPPAFLFGAGLALLPVALFIAAVAARPMAWALRLIVLGNLAWAAASLLLPALGLIAPNTLGWALLAGQALGVAGIALLEARFLPLHREIAQ
jgi:hypothetical protein